MNLTPQDKNNLKAFMERITLKPSEINAYAILMNKILGDENIGTDDSGQGDETEVPEEKSGESADIM